MIGGFQVKDVRRRHVTMIRDKLSADRPAWANAVVRVLSAALTFAWKDLEWIELSPCQKMALPKGGDGQVPLSEAEIERFREAEPYGTRARLGFEIMLGSPSIQISASTGSDAADGSTSGGLPAAFRMRPNRASEPDVPSGTGSTEARAARARARVRASASASKSETSRSQRGRPIPGAFPIHRSKSSGAPRPILRYRDRSVLPQANAASMSAGARPAFRLGTYVDLSFFAGAEGVRTAPAA